MFKGGVVLLTFSLILLNIMGTAIYPIEKEARLLHYKVEKAEKVLIDDISKYKCKLESKSYVDCKMSKHSFEMMESSYSLVTEIFKLSFLFGALLFIFSIISFLATTSKNNSDVSE